MVLWMWSRDVRWRSKEGLSRGLRSGEQGPRVLRGNESKRGVVSRRGWATSSERKDVVCCVGGVTSDGDLSDGTKGRESKLRR